MPFKDYYQILGIPTSASPDEIKAAYRSLALKYHPDRATDNPFAAAQFREIAEAYSTLSHPSRRRTYDEERWLRGATTRSRTASSVSATWILSEAQRLATHMETVDTYRMSHVALRDYILLLLSDQHLAIWHKEATPEQHSRLSTLILHATKGLNHKWFLPVTSRLLASGNPDPDYPRRIAIVVRERERKEALDKWMPLLVILTSIIICLAAFWLLHH